MADKALPYEVLKKVMSTCTGADYSHIALAVLEKEKPVAAGELRPS
jgi:biopolymer transport protein ExbD